MGLNVELTAILRDVVQFLECLREVKLPINLESIRDNLLIRSKDTLTTISVVERIGRSISPEPYLNMNAAGAKGFTVTPLKTEAELQEYVGAEHQEAQQQDYYESFQGVHSNDNAAPAVHETSTSCRNQAEQIEATFTDIYASFSAMQTKSKCQMCGSLYRKEGKKLFVFEQYRACWVGLVGFHLLVYGNDRDNRPCTILPIRGYMARAAPNAIPRDQRRSESTFEIFRPGSRTFQFVARSPKDMEQWVRKICELGGEKNERTEVWKSVDNVAASNDTTVQLIIDRTDPGHKEERYQDVGSLGIDKFAEEPSDVNDNDTSVREEEENFARKDTSHELAAAIDTAASTSRPHPSPPPPLPARIPRKLPSLPVHTSSYQFPDEEEDDIYHRIEDFKGTMRYGNVGESFRVQTNSDRSAKGSDTYDDVQAKLKNQRKSSERTSARDPEATKSIDSRNESMYDDTANTLLKDGTIVDQQDKFISYDDIENVISNTKSANHRPTDMMDESAKPPQKKSLLDRVRSKKESPRKTEKKNKRKVALSPTLRPSSPPPLLPVNDRQPATYYDDVSDLPSVPQQQEGNRWDEEQSEYTYPPPPRPIYEKPPEIVDVIESQEFYDDVTSYRDKLKDDRETSVSTRQTSKKSNQFLDTVHIDTARVACANIDIANRPSEDNEHYKTPRVESRYPWCIDQQADDLYDDIAILEDFTARQKEMLAKRDNESITRSQISPEKRSWNRFVSGRKSKAIDDSSDDLTEQNGPMRMNTFQKLISRMENSLGKTSARTVHAVK